MPSAPLGFTQHDHAHCVQSALVTAEAICARNAAQFTPVRRRVFEILLESHAAMGAYDVLERLDADGFGSKPPIAYRALSFLVDQGLVHRIERLNAFIACATPGDHHDPAFMICRGCGAVAEANAGQGPLSQSAKATGFEIEQTVIEAEGLCPDCQTAGACA